MPIIGSFGAGSAGGYGQRKGGRNELIFATGGTVTTCGDYRIHVFTGPGTFCVTAGGGDLGVADYMVVAGGGGGGPRDGGSGGGAGGFREAKTGNNGCYTASPLANPVGIQIEPGAYPITIGAGGPASDPTGPGAGSIFGDITSTGGGKGGGNAGQPGGSGGGNYGPVPASPVGDRAGNDPPVSPPQGNDGGIGSLPGNFVVGGGGGGAGTAGCFQSAGVGVGTEGFGPTGPSYGTPGPSAPLRYFSGGGGGAGDPRGGPGGVSGGYGGGGRGGPPGVGLPGTTNTGGGGGGTPNGSNPPIGGNGGSGIVMIRYKFQ
jgi:hypothetical protein